MWVLWPKLRILCAATGILKVEMRPGEGRKYDLWQEEGFFPSLQSCPGRTGEIWAGGLLRGIQEAFHLCSRKNEKFPLDFMKIKRIMQSTNR